MLRASAASTRFWTPSLFVVRSLRMPFVPDTLVLTVADLQGLGQHRLLLLQGRLALGTRQEPGELHDLFRRIMLDHQFEHDCVESSAPVYLFVDAPKLLGGLRRSLGEHLI